VVSLRGGDVPGTERSLERVHRWLRPVRRMVLAKARAVVANSPGLAQLSMRADPIAVQVIANGVDLETFSPAGSPRAGEFRFLFVGRLNEQKNVGMLLEAPRRCARHRPRNFACASWATDPGARS
ncbi:hypothetical protein I6F37_44210, partial [Bradyrhizobium sp. NBAIM08]|nr:hypothetical protein [Bradyrhizobium sp. NBAIM08]